MANELNKSEKAKGILAKIAAMFAADEATVEHKLADGTILKADKFEVGGKIAGVTVAGNFTLDNGTKISYDLAGVITEVTPPTPLALTDYKLKDGTMISCDKFEEGGSAKINGQPAATGVYELADGGSVTVGADGVITAVAKAAVAAAPDLTTPAGMLAEYEKITERLTAMGLRIEQDKETYVAALKVYTDSLQVAQSAISAANVKMAKQEEIVKEIFTLMTEVLGMPTAEVPGAGGKKKFSFADTESRKKTFGKFQEAAKKLADQWKEMDKVA